MLSLFVAICLSTALSAQRTLRELQRTKFATLREIDDGTSELRCERSARNLYVFKFEFQRDSAWQHDHKSALEYVHCTSKPKLASDLQKVLKRCGMTTTAGAGAIYLMVLHDIDPNRNLRRLIRAHHHSSDDVEDSLPDALVDIAIRRRSHEAAWALVAMKNGEYEAEMQALATYPLFISSPELIVSAISSSPFLSEQLLVLLPFGAWEAEQSALTANQVARRMERGSQGSERRLYHQIAQSRSYP
jgi:hypothetical protein